jgi:hypothetical protein
MANAAAFALSCLLLLAPLLVFKAFSAGFSAALLVAAVALSMNSLALGETGRRNERTGVNTQHTIQSIKVISVLLSPPVAGLRSGRDPVDAAAQRLGLVGRDHRRPQLIPEYNKNNKNAIMDAPSWYLMKQEPHHEPIK